MTALPDVAVRADSLWLKRKRASRVLNATAAIIMLGLLLWVRTYPHIASSLPNWLLWIAAIIFVGGFIGLPSLLALRAARCSICYGHTKEVSGGFACTQCNHIFPKPAWQHSSALTKQRVELRAVGCVILIVVTIGLLLAAKVLQQKPPDAPLPAQAARMNARSAGEVAGRQRAQRSTVGNVNAEADAAANQTTFKGEDRKAFVRGFIAGYNSERK